MGWSQCGLDWMMPQQHLCTLHVSLSKLIPNKGLVNVLLPKKCKPCRTVLCLVDCNLTRKETCSHSYHFFLSSLVPTLTVAINRLCRCTETQAIPMTWPRCLEMLFMTHGMSVACRLLLLLDTLVAGSPGWVRGTCVTENNVHCNKWGRRRVNGEQLTSHGLFKPEFKTHIQIYHETSIETLLNKTVSTTLSLTASSLCSNLGIVPTVWASIGWGNGQQAMLVTLANTLIHLCKSSAYVPYDPEWL